MIVACVHLSVNLTRLLLFILLHYKIFCISIVSKHLQSAVVSTGEKPRYSFEKKKLNNYQIKKILHFFFYQNLSSIIFQSLKRPSRYLTKMATGPSRPANSELSCAVWVKIRRKPSYRT